MQGSQAAPAPQPLKQAETLLLYLYAPSDPHYLRNLEFFVEQGIGANDGVDYVIIVQKVLAPAGCTPPAAQIRAYE